MTLSKASLRAVATVIIAASICVSVSAQELTRGTEPKNLIGTTGGQMAISTLNGQVKPLRNERLVKNRVHSQKAPRLKAGAPADMPAIYGCVVAANSWTTLDGVGIYRLPVSEGASFELVAAGPDAIYGGVLVGDTYYCTSTLEKFGMEFVKVASYDVTTWAAKTNTSASVSNKATDLAYDATNKKVYGCFQKEYGNGSNFGTMNMTTLGIDVIASTTDNWCAFAVDTDGTLYGIMKEVATAGSMVVTTSSSLYKINKQNGTKTLVGTTGCLPYYLSSACIDSRTGRMFWAVSAADDTAGLYEVDKNTGKATLICNFPDGEEVTGLFTVAPDTNETAPAAVSSLVASFPQGALSGTVSFDVPTTLFDGTAASGALTYKVMHGTSTLASGTTSFGSHVDASVTVPSPGIYELTVTVANENGESPAASVSIFIGKGIPSLPTVTACYDGANFNVSWTPVTESSDGGYINPEAITYKVVRYPAGVVVENATKATSVSNPVDEPDAITKYWYGVTASYDGKAGKEALSNNVFLGSLTPPFTQTFNSDAAVEPYMLVNANEDERTWYVYEGALRLYYNKTLDMDDWIISPVINLEKGKSYRFVLRAKAQSYSYKEAFEVKYGKESTVEAMNTVIIPRTEILNNEFEEFEGFITPSETGRYHIGIHACSEMNSYALYIGGYTIEQPTLAGAPSAPTGMRTVPDPNGAFRTTIFVTAPTTDFNNETLGSLSHLELSRDGNVIKTFRPIAPGETVSFADELSSGGNHRYSAVAYNEYGKGDECAVTAYVGVNVPAAPSKVDIVETADDGIVTVSWDKVDTDYAGNPLNPDLVTYTLWQLQAETYVVLYDNIAGNSQTFRAVTPPNQTFVHFFVSAQTETGMSPLTETALIPCGQPYALPFNEKFRNGDTESIMAIDDEGNALWSLMQDNNSIGITSRDGDNGFLLSRGRAEGDFSMVYTAKVKIDGVSNPGVSFYTYNVNIDDTPDRNIIEVCVDDGNGFKSIKSAEVCSLSANTGWVMMSASLADYVGKTILVGFKTTVVNYFETIIDDIKIASLTDYDVAVTDCSAPESAPFNKPFAVSAKIENLGVQPAENLKAKLLCDGATAATKEISVLAPGEYVNIAFEPAFTALQKNAAIYAVEVEFASDMDMTNNRSTDMTVVPLIPTLPAPSGLRAVRSGSDVALTWEAPVTDGYEAVPVTDDFEDYESFATDFGDWTNYDGDKAAIGTITDVQIPGIPFNSQQAWWVMDADYEAFNKSFYSHSGHRYLAQMYAIGADGTAFPCDDRLVSPRLTGKTQTISFYARSYSSTYPESFEIMVSSTGNESSDFKTIASKASIPAEWTLYSFSLPEGTEYFALRCVSLNKFMMFVDDITYTPASASELTLEAYNLWRDGSLIATVDADKLSYTEPLPADTDTEYLLTAVYDKGESAPCDGAHIDMSAVTIVGLYGLDIRVSDHRIMVTGAGQEEVLVYAPDGRMVARSAAAATHRIPVEPGVYIVAVGQTTTKVFVGK